MRSISIISSEKTASRIEFDSHADSPVVGKGAIILHHIGETINVIPFIDDLGTCSDIPIVTAAVAYDSPITGERTIFLIHNALYIANMTQNLIPPIMIRMNGIEVNECPQFLASESSESHHSILLPITFRIPLSLHGSFSFIPTRRPSTQDYHNILNVPLTAENPSWNPHCSSFASQENNIIHHNGSIRTKTPTEMAIYSVINDMKDDMNIPYYPDSKTSSIQQEVSPALDTKTLLSKCVSHTTSSFKQQNKKLLVDHHRLASNWKIGTEIARKTSRLQHKEVLEQPYTQHWIGALRQTIKR